MQKNEVYEMEITGMTEEGDGVGRVDGMAVFVPYTIPGEMVRAVIVKVKKSFAYGRLLEVLHPSLHRTKAACPYFYQCGGCQLWHMDLEAELSYKRQKVADCLSRIAGLDIVPEEVVCTQQTTRYRNKSQYPVTPDGIGLYRRNSHTVIPMEDCMIQGEHDAAVIRMIRTWMERYRIAPYDEQTDSGFLRHIYIREGETGMLLTLVTRGCSFPERDALICAAEQLGFPLVGIVQNVNPKRTNVVLGSENHVLWGKGYLTDSIGKVQFHISPLSFYQVNRFATRTLYEIAAGLAKLTKDETLWDIYCGIGTIGLFMAKKAKAVIGIETCEAAVENAKENARLNGIANAKYYCGKAEAVAPRLAEEGEAADVVILDPPRKGCDEKLLETVARVEPKRIVYISCMPSTLARDLKSLNAKGYEVQKAVPVNMFPRCSHVETACLLSHKSPDSHINVTVEFGEGEGKVPLDKIVERAKQHQPAPKATYKLIQEYVEMKYGFKVHTAYIAEVKRELGLPMYDAPNAAEGLKQTRKHPTQEKVNAIKDALNYYNLI
mgnify:FL=1